MSTITFGVVHGTTVDGHFFESMMNYMQRQSHDEWERMSASLKEAAGHIDDTGLADKYRQEADQRLFQGSFLGIRSGPLLSAGRGALCQSFLDQTDEPWLMMMDSDMTYDPRTVTDMVRIAEEQDLKILGGVAWIIWTDPAGNVVSRVPNVYKTVNFADGEYLSPISADELPKSSLAKVGACGGAVLLMHRDVLLGMRDTMFEGRPHWFHHLPTPNGDQYGEDTSFCLNVRKYGEAVWVHTGARFGHSKTHVEYGIDEEGNINHG